MSTRQTSYYSYSHHKLDNLALNRPADGRRKPSEMSPVLDTEKCQQVTRSDLTTSLPARDSLENDSTAYFVFSTFISCQFLNIILHNQYFNSHRGESQWKLPTLSLPSPPFQAVAECAKMRQVRYLLLVTSITMLLSTNRKQTEKQ